jgi:hypothetical protein
MQFLANIKPLQITDRLNPVQAHDVTSCYYRRGGNERLRSRSVASIWRQETIDTEHIYLGEY